MILRRFFPSKLIFSLAAVPCPCSGQPRRNDPFSKCRVCGHLGRPPPTWRPDQRGSPLDHKAAKRKMAEKLLAGGVAARGTSGRMPAHQRAPAARREQKTTLCDAPDRYSGPVYFGRDPIGEGPETRRITTAFVSGGDPELVEGERTCTKRDGLRPERSTRSFPGSSWSRRRGKPARFVQGGRVPGECAHGTRALQGQSAGTDSEGSSASGTSFKMMRRHDPD